MRETHIRVPLMHGLPKHTLGSMDMRFNSGFIAIFGSLVAADSYVPLVDLCRYALQQYWIPAFAGMTGWWALVYQLILGTPIS